MSLRNKSKITLPYSTLDISGIVKIVEDVGNQKKISQGNLLDGIITRDPAKEYFYDGPLFTRYQIFKETNWMPIEAMVQFWATYPQYLHDFIPSDLYEIGHRMVKNNYLGILNDLGRLMPFESPMWPIPGLIESLPGFQEKYFSKVDHIKIEKPFFEYTVISYHIDKNYKDLKVKGRKVFDSSFNPTVLGIIENLPLIQFRAPGVGKQIASWNNLLDKINVDYKVMGIKAEKKEDKYIWWDAKGKNKGEFARLIKVGKKSNKVNQILETYLPDKWVVECTKDVLGTSPGGREKIIVSRNTCYETSKSLFLVDYSKSRGKRDLSRTDTFKYILKSYFFAGKTNFKLATQNHLRILKEKEILEDQVKIVTKELEEKNRSLEKTITILEETLMEERNSLLEYIKPFLGDDFDIGNDIDFELGENIKTIREAIDNSGEEKFKERVGGLAHDFTNVLNAITGFAEIASFEYKDLENQESPIKFILSSVERAKRITNQLLEVKKDIIFYNSYNISEIVSDIINSPERLKGYDSKLIDIYSIVEPDLELSCNSEEFESTIENLTINAFESMEGKKGNVYIHLYGDDDLIFFKIQDDGSGMDEKTERQIFDRGFTTKKENGTGIGLYEIYKRMEKYGSIKCDSELQNGTTFILQFNKNWNKKE
jgi:signal transduction histidine kinase